MTAAETDEDAAIVTTGIDWSKELGSLGSRAQRIERRASLLAIAERTLSAQLEGLGLQLERLEALGAWTVRGPRAMIANLRAAGGPLAGTEFEVVPNDQFHSLAP